MAIAKFMVRLLTVLLAGVPASVLCASESLCRFERITCTTKIDDTTGKPSNKFDVVLKLVNHSECSFLVMDQPGFLWADREHRVFHLAHYAFTKQRQLNLGGIQMTREFFAPKFTVLESGEAHELQFSVVLEEAGEWLLAGRVSILPSDVDTSVFYGEDGADRMAQLDSIVQCEGVTLRVSPRAK